MILGCTHFPIIRDAIAGEFEEGTLLVDSASTTATAAADLLDRKQLANAQGDGSLRLCATDGAKRFARVGGRFLGEDLAVGDIELVDL